MARGEFLITALEAAEYLGITFGRFKVAIFRGLGKDPKRSPNGHEAKPVVGGWSARSAKYRATDIKRMHEHYPFRTDRTPDNGWFRLVASPARTVSKPIPTPVSRPQFTVVAVPVPVATPARARMPRPPAPRSRSRVPRSDGNLFDWLL